MNKVCGQLILETILSCDFQSTILYTIEYFYSLLIFLIIQNIVSWEYIVYLNFPNLIILCFYFSTVVHTTGRVFVCVSAQASVHMYVCVHSHV